MRNSAVALVYILGVSMGWMIGCNSPSQMEKNGGTQPSRGAQETDSILSDAVENPEFGLVDRLVLAEDLALDLTFHLKELADWMASPIEQSAAPSFLEMTKCVGAAQLTQQRFDELSRKSTLEAGVGVSAFDWPLASVPLNGATRPLQSLAEILGDLRSFKFGVLSADFTDAKRSVFEMETKLSAQAVSNKMLSGIAGRQMVIWELRNGTWYLTGWESKKLSVTTSETKMFEDVTARCIPDPATLKSVQRSRHEELISKMVLTGEMPKLGSYTPYIDAASPHALPSVSVVDFDNDQRDDLFISGRWCPTQLLRNMGDGRFEDVTEDVGLSFPAVVNCSAFVDLDNDGDKDAIIGRSLEPLVYLRNDDGKFVNVTWELSDLEGQYLVSAISVSDINRDGLLDLYLSTYGPFGQNVAANVAKNINWERRFLSMADAEEIAAKKKSGHWVVDVAGPPNLLVMNRGGGRLETFKGDDLTRQWHHSYQSAWADIDQDGDDDLYIANDFAGDALLINETPVGADAPVFVDGVTTHFQSSSAGFGMGVSWGDYDSDGDLDLYVSNMYSKAGMRILKFLGPGDERIDIATRGNFLYRNDGGRFQNVAGTGAGKQSVGRVGWSYGGQFIDIDNNGRLDLYVPSGYFTAVAESDSKVDI